MGSAFSVISVCAILILLTLLVSVDRVRGGSRHARAFRYHSMFIASHQLSRLRRVHFARFVFTVYVFGQIALSDRRRYFARSVFDKPIAKHFLQTVPLSMLF